MQIALMGAISEIGIKDDFEPVEATVKAVSKDAIEIVLSDEASEELDKQKAQFEVELPDLSSKYRIDKLDRTDVTRERQKEALKKLQAEKRLDEAQVRHCTSTCNNQA